MADRHIDYNEVSEYGWHFVREASALEAVAAPLVDVGAVKQLVADAIRAVETEMGVNTSGASTLRGQRTDADVKSETARSVLRRLFRYLGSLPAHVAFDLEAFFPGGVTGDLTHLKPADLLAACEQAVRGFNAPRNLDWPGRASWHAEVVAARDELAGVLQDKGNAKSDKRVASRALIDARKRFLHTYNQVAKPLIRGALAHLGRGQEYRQYFLDLQVDESARSRSEDAGDAPAEPSSDTPASSNA